MNFNIYYVIKPPPGLFHVFVGRSVRSQPLIPRVGMEP